MHVHTAALTSNSGLTNLPANAPAKTVDETVANVTIVERSNMSVLAMRLKSGGDGMKGYQPPL